MFCGRGGGQVRPWGRSRAAVLTLALLVLCLAGPLIRTASACYCGPPRPPKVELRKAKAVFEGVVITTTTRGEVSTFHFRVLRAWKGVSQQEVVVYSAPLLCGVTAREEEKWLVFAWGEGSSLWTGHCGNTGRSETKVAELKALGKPSWSPPGPGTDVAPPQNNEMQRTKPAQAKELRR